MSISEDFNATPEKRALFWIPRVNDIVLDFFRKMSAKKPPHPEFVEMASLAILRFMEIAYQLNALESCLQLSKLDLVLREFSKDPVAWENCRKQIVSLKTDYQIAWERESAGFEEEADQMFAEMLTGKQPASEKAATDPIPEPLQTDTVSEGEFDGTYGYLSDLESLDPEMVETYMAENNEQIYQAEQQLLEFETNPGNKKIINELFRLLHTIKGNSGLMGFVEFQELTHSMEQYMDLVRKNKLPANGISTDMMLEGVDLLKQLQFNLKSRVEFLGGKASEEGLPPVKWKWLAEAFNNQSAKIA